MKSNKRDTNIARNSSINYCCAEIMSLVSELNDKQYNQLFNSLCKILNKTPLEMNNEIYNNNLSGSPKIK